MVNTRTTASMATVSTNTSSNSFSTSGNVNMPETGYGPRALPGGSSVNISHLCFSGKSDDYETWEDKVLAYLSEQGFDDVFSEAAAVGSSAEAVARVTALNRRVYNIVIQVLDRESIRLVRNDAKHNGREVFNILRNHFCGSGRSRVLSLFTEIGRLRKKDRESVTSYILRAEEIILALKIAKHPIDEMMSIALVVNGLPGEYRQFRTIVFQTDGIKKFADLKNSLINFEHDEVNKEKKEENVVLKVESYNDALRCYICNEVGHKSYQCESKPKRWCKFCKSSTHDFKFCYKNSSANCIADGECREHLLFTVTTSMDFQSDESLSKSDLLVDCGATVHIICEKDRFLDFDPNFNPEDHAIKLADGSRSVGILSLIHI